MSEKNNPTKEFHLEATRVHKKLLQSQEEKIEAILESDPERPIRERESDRVATLRQISELQKVLDVCLPYIRRIKSFVPKISDETVEAACYLLFCQVLQHFEAVFVLSAEGKSVPAGELTRAIGEALDLIVLFEVEGKNSSHLKKWFDGEIVENRKARDSAHRFMNEGRKDPLPVAELKARIYAGLSKYSHMSYAALLESIDVYERDFDWRRCAGFHYTNSGTLPFALEMMRSLITTLKQFYLSRDPEVFPALDKIHENCSALAV
jgi:hypothetical protein